MHVGEFNKRNSKALDFKTHADSMTGSFFKCRVNGSLLLF